MVKDRLIGLLAKLGTAFRRLIYKIIGFDEAKIDAQIEQDLKELRELDMAEHIRKYPDAGV